MSDTVREIENGHEVTSGKSGKTYTVTTETRLDELGSMYFKMKCSCPAGRYGRNCHHIETVENYRWQQAVQDRDYDQMDVLERTS